MMTWRGQAAPIGQACRRSILALPHISRFTNLSFVIWPSVCPFDQGSKMAALTAALSLAMPVAKDVIRLALASAIQGSRSSATFLRMMVVMLHLARQIEPCHCSRDDAVPAIADGASAAHSQRQRRRKRCIAIRLPMPSFRSPTLPATRPWSMSPVSRALSSPRFSQLIRGCGASSSIRST
jgi:hypothetical protein